MSRETRVLQEAELRASKSDEPTIEGYAAVFGKRSENLGGFYEYIAPGAFDRALREGQDVRALIDHESSKILGRTASGTLELSVDARGLKVKIKPPRTSYARDLLESIDRGDVSQMSFAFRTAPGGDTWRNEPEDGLPVRVVTDVDLYDVSAVTFPAYPDTTVATRRLEGLQATFFRPSEPVPQADGDGGEHAAEHLQRVTVLRSKVDE
jgi:hypothetical protein